MTLKSNLKFIAWALLWAALPFIIFLLLVIINYDNSGKLEIEKLLYYTAVFSFFISFLWVPGLLLHLRYYLFDKNKTIRFRPTYLEIIERSKVSKIYFKQIAKIERHQVSWSPRKFPWSEYSYVKIIFYTTKFYSFNCLTDDVISSVAKFQQHNIPVEDYQDIYPWLSKSSG